MSPGQEQKHSSPVKSSGTFASKVAAKLQVPDATDTVKDNELTLDNEAAQVQLCRAVVCHACGKKDHDYDPHEYFLPCDHPWVLAASGQLCMAGYMDNGTRTLLDPSTGGRLSSQYAQDLESTKDCGCFDRSKPLPGKRLPSRFR